MASRKPRGGPTMPHTFWDGSEAEPGWGLGQTAEGGGQGRGVEERGGRRRRLPGRGSWGGGGCWHTESHFLYVHLQSIVLPVLSDNGVLHCNGIVVSRMAEISLWTPHNIWTDFKSILQYSNNIWTLFQTLLFSVAVAEHSICQYYLVTQQ